MATRYLDNAGARMPQAFTYNDAAEVLANSRNGNLGANTRIFRDPGSGDIHVRLYNTNIITYRLDGSIVLNTGGHRTATTKARINAFLSPKLSVYSKGHKWYVKSGSGIAPFEDGAIITVVETNPEVQRGGVHVDIHSHNPPRIVHKVGKGRTGPLVKVYRHPDTDEYEVVHERQRIGEGYFTTDKQDAIDTANTMSRERHNPSRGDNEKSERLFRGSFGQVLVSAKVWRAALDNGRAKEFPSHSTVGGYPLYYVIGERTARKNFQYDNLEEVLASTINSNQLGADDVVIDVEVNWEDEEMYDGITGEPIPSAYGGDENENPKSRQVIFKQTGGTAYGKAQRVAFDLRSAGFEADQGSIPSQAGSWADTIYVMTNAPMAAIRKAAKSEGLEINS